MITKLSDILVVSDLDGTLLTAKTGIPSCNIETIRLFTTLGGHFTIATGRSIQSADRYIKQLQLNTPAILYHGGAIYDTVKNIPVCHCTLNKASAANAIADILDKFPQIGVEIMAADEKTYLINSNQQTYNHFSHEELPYIASLQKDITCDWYKVLFAGPEKIKLAVQNFVAAKNYHGVYFTSTDPVYLEMLPEGINKGIALKKLCHMLELPLENTFAIGNYYNDLDLLNAAGCAVAVNDSVNEVKNIANVITGNCLDGGVAQFLYSLIKKYS